MTTVFDFEDADIGRLAIHIRETLTDRPARAYPLPAIQNGVEVGNGAGILTGLVVTGGSAGGASGFTLYDGTDADGQVLLVGTVVATGTFTLPLAGCGVRFTRGLYLSSPAVLSATVFARFDYRR